MMVKLSIASVEMPTIITSSVKVVAKPLKLKVGLLKSGPGLWPKNMAFAMWDILQRSSASAVNASF
jgi:hypothetical protein